MYNKIAFGEHNGEDEILGENMQKTLIFRLFYAKITIK